MNNDEQNSMVLGNVDNSVSTSNPENLGETLNNPTMQVMDNLGGNEVLTGNNNEKQLDNSINNSVIEPSLNNNSSMVMEGPSVKNEPPFEAPPAYTNPQTIEPVTNNYEPQGSIGMTPPVSLEAEKKPKKEPNKTLFIVIVLIALAAVGLGTYYVLNYTDLFAKKEEITIETKNIEINIGEALPESITEYATITGTIVSNCNPIAKNISI